MFLNGIKKYIPHEGHEEEIPSHMRTWLETPFTIYHKRGVVEKVEVAETEPEYIVNLKKGLVSQLQYDLSEAKLEENESRSDSFEPIPVFKTNETTILGECETIYTISKLPEWTTTEYEVEGSPCRGKQHYVILKSKNLESCSIHPVYHKSYGLLPRPEGTNTTFMPEQSSLTRTIICGTLEDYVIKNTTTTNDILSSPTGIFETKDKVHTSTYTILDLESVERIEREIPKPSSPKSYPSLVFEYTYKSLPESSGTSRYEPVGEAPLPDLTSAPSILRHSSVSQEDLKEKIVKIFTEIIESSKRMTETSMNKKDVAGLSVTATKILSRLSLKTLKEVEQPIKTRIEREENKTLLEKVFFDLVSMAGTNPCVMLIKEKIVSGDVIEYPETWAWIISNTLRTIRTPTKELIEELVELLKTEHIERNRIIRAAYVMGLTELIHKACVNPLTIRNEYPYRIYGQMCYKDMPVIKDTLIPYLSQKLSESSRTDNNTVITFTSALGNIGTEESTEELLKVIEGKIPTPTYPRALAVYMLIKPALIKPSIYKPIFLSIIENPAEHSDVKQNAIFGLVSSYPSSTDLQRLALRTWFEPSRQTVSLIYSTLKSLTELSGSNPEYERLRIKAQLILPMAKPVTEGYQYSRNYHYTSFVESLRTLVSHRLTWTSTEQSFIPTTFYNKMQLKSSIGDKTSEIINNGELEKGLRTEFFKILDLHRSNYIMPTESGMPVYLTLKTPTVTQMKGEIKLSGKHTEQPGAEFSTVVVSNIKKLLHSGVKSELTKRFYGVGVETSMHVAVPVKGEVSYRKGQVQVTLKQTKEPGFQREHSVLEFDVHPFTTSQSLSDFEVMSKGRYVKTIKTRESELKKEVNVGKPIGFDLKLKLETEEIPLNTYSIFEKLRIEGVSGSIISLISTIKRTKLQLLFSPSTSETKELDLHLNVGYGLMKNQQKQATIRILDA